MRRLTWPGRTNLLNLTTGSPGVITVATAAMLATFSAGSGETHWIAHMNRHLFDTVLPCTSFFFFTFMCPGVPETTPSAQCQLAHVNACSWTPQGTWCPQTAAKQEEPVWIWSQTPARSQPLQVHRCTRHTDNWERDKGCQQWLLWSGCLNIMKCCYSLVNVTL